MASTLDWWTEAGADCTVADVPRGWLKPLPSSHPAGPEPQSLFQDEIGRRGPGTDENAPGLRAAGAEEALPDQLGLFQDWLRTSETLPYASPAAPRVCPVGDPAAGLMVITAMPSTDDCGAGILLSGPPGALFDRMLAAIGRSRDAAYLAGLSCLRPGAGRFDAAGGERCAAIARHHVALAAPRALLLLGDDCTKALLGMSVAAARGRVHALEAGGHRVDAIATLHPDYLLRQPAFKAHAWADLQLLMEALS